MSFFIHIMLESKMLEISLIDFWFADLLMKCLRYVYTSIIILY